MKDDDNVPSKHLWDFCTVMPEIELGLSDYRRVAKRKIHGWHICEDGEFEQGISYFHSTLELGTSKFPDSLMDEVNQTAENLIGKRQKLLMHGWGKLRRSMLPERYLSYTDLLMECLTESYRTRSSGIRNH